MAELNGLVMGVVLVFIGAILLTGIAPTIHSQTDVSYNSTGGTSGTTGALVNITNSGARTIYPLYDLIWAVAGLLLIVGGAFTLYQKMTD